MASVYTYLFYSLEQVLCSVECECIVLMCEVFHKSSSRFFCAYIHGFFLTLFLYRVELCWCCCHEILLLKMFVYI